ncbi:hypothetical protein A3D76_05430 [Candidatus Roizmanbacteria bacterium RIFCSPHIGHO2_02_FULL_37_9b]|nr:MAG: hypothetical protein A3D76_05430 [Candidatus Roizmanbacteria bacterium RIFCSPHIGHO2_02_FULL_37_9b]
MAKRKFFYQSGVGAVVLLIIISLIAGSVLLLKNKSSKPQALPGTPILSFSTDPISVGSDENFDLVLKVNPNGAEFHAFELYAKYDLAKVDFQSQDDLSQNIASAYPLIISAIDTGNQTISVVGTRLGSAFTGSEDQEIARVKMKNISGSGAGLLFSWSEDTKLGDKIAFQKLNSQP